MPVFLLRDARSIAIMMGVDASALVGFDLELSH
jgi:hypothetical protein